MEKSYVSVEDSLKRTHDLGRELLERVRRRDEDWWSAPTYSGRGAEIPERTFPQRLLRHHVTEMRPELLSRHSVQEERPTSLEEAFSALSRFMRQTTEQCERYHSGIPARVMNRSEQQHVSRFHGWKPQRTPPKPQPVLVGLQQVAYRSWFQILHTHTVLSPSLVTGTLQHIPITWTTLGQPRLRLTVSCCIPHLPPCLVIMWEIQLDAVSLRLKKRPSNLLNLRVRGSPESNHVISRQEISAAAPLQSSGRTRDPRDVCIEVAPGTYSISAGAPNYPTQTHLVHITPGQSVDLTFNV